MMPVLPPLFVIICVTLFLCACTAVDLKHKEVSLDGALALVIVQSVYQLTTHYTDWMTLLLGFTVAFIPYFLMAAVGNGGAGDAVVMGAVGYCIGSNLSVFFCFVASVLYLLVIGLAGLKTKNWKIQLPFVPFALGAWGVALIACLLVK